MEKKETREVTVYVCEGCNYEWGSKQWTCDRCGGDVGACCGITLEIRRFDFHQQFGRVDLHYHPHCFSEFQKYFANTMNINLLPICKTEGS